MNVLKVLGSVVDAGSGVLNVVKLGEDVVKTVSASPSVVAVSAPNEGDVQKLTNLVGGVGKNGDKGKAIGELYPHLPAKYLNAVLHFADSMTSAIENDGTIDGMEITRAVLDAIGDLA